MREGRREAGEDREEEACEDREKRDKQRELEQKQEERCEMFDSVVTQLPLSSRELLRREPDFLNYLPLSVNRNTHLWLCFHTLILTRLLPNRAGGWFHVANSLKRGLRLKQMIMFVEIL